MLWLKNSDTSKRLFWLLLSSQTYSSGFRTKEGEIVGLTDRAGKVLQGRVGKILGKIIMVTLKDAPFPNALIPELTKLFLR